LLSSLRMSSRNAPRTILLVGPPRSGTTWVADVLNLAGVYQFVNEPDNEIISLLGRRYKRYVPRFPLLAPGDTPRDFTTLWEKSLASPLAPWLARGRLARYVRAPDAFVTRKEKPFTPDPAPSPAMRVRELGRDAARPPVVPRPRLIKTVHAVLCVEWVCSVVPIDRVVVVMRHPLAILASWRRLKMPDAARPYALSDDVQRRVLGDVIPVSSELETQALHLAVLFRGLASQVKRNPDWLLLVHEDLCVDPRAKFRAMYGELGLDFTPVVERGIAARDRAGDGYRPVRRAADEVGKWKKDYRDDELARASAILDRAGLSAWL